MDFNGADLNMMALKDDVRLTGVLDDPSQIDSALKIARTADAVHSIDDEVTISK